MEDLPDIQAADLPASLRAVSGHEQFALQGRPSPVWASYDKDGWRIALLIHHLDGGPILSEVRFFPAEDRQVPGEWSGDPSSVPEGGFPPSLLRVRLGRWRDQTMQLLVDPTAGYWQDRLPNDAAEEWWDTVGQSGIEAGASPRVPERRRGRRPLSDEEHALVAKFYVESIEQAAQTTNQYIARCMRESGLDIAPSSVSGRVGKAREHGFLTSAPGRGRAGGRLTPKARNVLMELEHMN